MGRELELAELGRYLSKALRNERQIVSLPGSRASEKPHWPTNSNVRQGLICPAFVSRAVSAWKGTEERKLTTQSWKRWGSCVKDRKESQSSRSWPHKRPPGWCSFLRS